MLLHYAVIMMRVPAPTRLYDAWPYETCSGLWRIIKFVGVAMLIVEGRCRAAAVPLLRI